MSNTLKAVIAMGPSLARLARGAVATGNRSVPPIPLELFDCENDSECRPVREALTTLDLEAMIYPVPKSGTRFRKQLTEISGSDSVPFLHDPNTGEHLQGARPIVDYLYAQFASEGKKAPMKLLPLASVANALRGSKGRNARPSKAPEQPLELYSFEASPFARLVRELLCDLEIPHLLHSVGKTPGKMAEWLPPILRENKVKGYQPETENRRKLVARGGHMMVPYLVDPNNGVDMYQSADIQAYLLKTYGA